MKIKFFAFLVHAFNGIQTNGTESIESNISNEKLDALFDHECRECAHNFNDGGLEQGRMVTVLPVIHPTYKLSLEFYVWGLTGGAWDNLFHFTQGTENGHSCDLRQFGLWVRAISGDTSQLGTHIAFCVNGAGRNIRPNIGKDRWNSLEYGQYVSRTETSDLTHHQYIMLNGEIIHEEINLKPQTFNDVSVYVSTPWYPAAYGVIRKFQYRKYDDFCLNYCP